MNKKKQIKDSGFKPTAKKKMIPDFEGNKGGFKKPPTVIIKKKSVSVDKI